MSKTTPKSLSELIAAKTGALSGLADQARLREDLSDYLRKSLPPELAEGFVHCNLGERNTLVIVASTPAWASRLRFESNRFIELCAAQGTPVMTVKIRVAVG